MILKNRLEQEKIIVEAFYNRKYFIDLVSKDLFTVQKSSTETIDELVIKICVES